MRGWKEPGDFPKQYYFPVSPLFHSKTTLPQSVGRQAGYSLFMSFTECSRKISNLLLRKALEASFIFSGSLWPLYSLTLWVAREINDPSLDPGTNYIRESPFLSSLCGNSFFLFPSQCSIAQDPCMLSKSIGLCLKILSGRRHKKPVR